ncbi:MAG: beta-Ala-His dipeptidase [Candidatus Thorarchaeota archaeon]
MVLEKLKPKIVWKIFEEIIASTPRPSGKEAKIREKIKNWLKKEAEDPDLEIRILEDKIGNLLIKRPATKDMRECSPLLLQAHLDMVCETDRPKGYEFENLGIPMRIQDNNEWIDADGTTLGADNGIGVALALALLTDKTIQSHCPIEILLTVNEEDGFDGATLLDPSVLDIKSKLMINLDGGPLGVVVIGSVCGRRIRFSKRFKWIEYEENNNFQFYILKVNGLLSGHSGEDIKLPRANAIKLVSRIMSKISQKLKIYISKWQGGTKANVIPAESIIAFGIHVKDKDKFEDLIQKEISNVYEYYEKFEPNLKIEYNQINPEDYLSNEDSIALLSTANLIPHGVIKKSHVYEDFVESSNNFAIVNTEKRNEIFWIYPRSIIRSELDSFCISIKQLGAFGGWRVFLNPVLPEWLPDLDSKFLKFILNQYKVVLNKPIETNIVHGGLETGMISTRIPGLQMVSLGPTMENLHSPSERIKISDVDVLYELLKRVISNLKELKL